MRDHCKKKMDMILFEEYKTYIRDCKVFPNEFWGMNLVS